MGQRKYEVAICHAPEDADIAQQLALQLISNGLRVWYPAQAEAIEKGLTPRKITNALHQTKVLLVCLSGKKGGPNQALYDDAVSKFQDPANTDRRVIFVKLDDGLTPEVAEKLPYIEWRPVGHDAALSKILSACGSQGAEVESGKAPSKKITLGDGRVQYRDFVFSRDGERVFSAAFDNTVRMWDLNSGKCLKTYQGHTNYVWHLA